MEHADFIMEFHIGPTVEEIRKFMLFALHLGEERGQLFIWQSGE